MPEYVIEINSLTKIYQTGKTDFKALNNVDLRIRKGDFVAIMGPSGSGKSTLMNIIGCLDRPTSGTIIIDGENISTVNDNQLAIIRGRKIGFIFQAYNLLPRTTALKNVMLPMVYAGIPPEQRLEKAKKFLEIVGLSDRMEHFPNQLSGGQQQRVAIARALVMNPSILLADEPTGNIATAQAKEIMEIFQRLNHEGHTIVMITHDPEIAHYAHRIISIRDGQIIDDASHQATIRPAN